MKEIETALFQGIKDGVFPSASLLVSKAGSMIYRKNVGCDDKALFDIASLTKPLATASLFLKLLEEKKVFLHQPLSHFLKSFERPDKQSLTFKHLLDHTSGLPAWKPYFKILETEHPSLLTHWEARQWYLQKISEEVLENPTGTKRVYSDLGFMILGIIIENIFRDKLDALFKKHVADPLGLKNTFFIRVGEKPPLPVRQFLPTEDSPWRHKIIQAEVHDDNAYALGGVAGHAGLFSTVDDLHQFCLEIVNQRKKLMGEYSLGWDTPSPQDSQAGKYFLKNSIGHLGYTGCSMWIDFDQDFHIILLTNRVHPTSQNEKIKTLRPQLHNLIYEQLIQ